MLPSSTCVNHYVLACFVLISNLIELSLPYAQFSNHGPLDSHGFARNRVWSIDSNPPPFPTSSASKTFVDLILKPSEDDLKIWPNR